MSTQTNDINKKVVDILNRYDNDEIYGVREIIQLFNEMVEKELKNLESFVFCGTQPDKGDQFAIVSHWLTLYKKYEGNAEQYLLERKK